MVDEVTAAKSARTAAKRIFNRNVKKVSDSIEEEDASSVVETRFQDLKRLWNDVQEKHEKYIAAIEDSKTSYNADAEDKWIDEMDVIYENILRKNFAYLEVIEDAKLETEKQQREIYEEQENQLRKQKSDQAIERAKQTRNIEETAFNQEVQNLESMLDLEAMKSSPAVSMLEMAQSELKKQLEQCKKAHGEYVVLLPPERYALEVTWITNLQRIYSQLSQKTGEIIQQKKDTDRDSLKGNGLRLESMKMPHFSGNIRDYPRFRSDFEHHIFPELGSGSKAAYVLKSCLSDAPFDAVCNVDDDIKEMWKRLDEKYGQPSKLADVVVFDIKNMGYVKEGDDEAFLELVNTVERGYRDLIRVKMECEISNNGTVSLIEERLPRDIKREWSREVNKSGSVVEEKNKFPYLLKFLQEQRRIIEYESSDLRNGSPIRKGRANLIDAEGKFVDDKMHQEDKIRLEDKAPRCLIHNSNNHITADCRVFHEKTPEEKIQLLKEKRACWSCLKSGHRSVDCRSRKRCNVENCLKFHHESLHLAHVQGVAFHTPAAATKAGSQRDNNKVSACLLQVMRVKSLAENTLNVLWDGGATISLITFNKAKELNLDGENIQLSVVKVGGSKEEIRSSVYTLPLIDESGKTVTFQVYGIDRISSPMQYINLEGVLHLFEGLNKDDIERPEGEIDVLIGFEYAGHHPVRKQSSGHLLLLRNRFGYCLGGSHMQLAESTINLIQNATAHHIARVDIESFFDTEALGVECSPKCGSCRCGRCPIGGKSFTLKEERELKLIEEGLSHNGDHWVAQYPWVRDPRELPDNREVALKMLKDTEKRLQRDGSHLQMYKEQINDMLQRGVARKLTQTELDEYDGPVHYLSHHAVLKPESASTPCRIVFNSSARYQGHSLNDYWAKGPDLMNNMLGILLRFREGPVAFVGDIRKMYHAVKISIIDQHTHRFLWHDMPTNCEPSTYVMTSVSFGDKPAGNIATVALRKTAEMQKEDFPIASDVILNNTYVDDIAESTDNMKLAVATTSQIDELIKHGGFEIKHWTYATTEEGNKVQDLQHDHGSPMCERDVSDHHAPPVKESSNEQKVLGLQWNSNEDEFRFKVQLNFSPKIRKCRSGPNLNRNQVPSSIPPILTKRMVLSQINGIYDPLGLATPFTVRAKMLMRKLWIGESKILSWDDPIPDCLREDWLEFFVELFEMQDIKFRRCIKPRDAIGDPSLVMFSDGSDQAYGTCAYARWQLANGKFASNLIAAKSRVTPIRKITIVRIELNGALLSKRLSAFIKKESRFVFSKEFFIVDSEIVRAMVQKESYGFNTYAAVRVGEIQEGTSPSDWYWVEGKLNIADWTTRGKSPQDLHEESVWQKGPEFLQLPESEWPIKIESSIDQLPEETKSALVIEVANERSLSNVIDITRFSCYHRLLRVTARIVAAVLTREPKPSMRNLANPVEAPALKNAEYLWIKEAQKSIQQPFEHGKFRRLCARKRDDGIIVVGGRILKSAESSYDEQELILMPYSHRMSRLYAERIHNRGHAGVSATVSKIRARFWIINLRRIVRSIKHQCVICRKKEKSLEGQIMGPLPEERMTPAPAWSATGVDFFGPFQTRGETNKRSRGKAYGLIFNCLASRAVYVDIATDYSTQGFLMVLRRFVSIRGYPKQIFSDCGSQLAAASKELKSVIEGLNKDRLREFGAEHGLEWRFTAADAPWQNGCSESLVKSVKTAIKGAIGDQVLMFSEFQTVCFEAANLVNERPIGVHPTDPKDDAYLSPNHLLLGRASARIPSGPFRQTKNERLRFEFVQKLVDSFWKRWIRDWFPSLLVRQKWHVDKRNVCVGDVVMVQDSNAVRGQWKIARVSKTFPGIDGRVRKVEVQYKCPPLNESPRVCKGRAYTTIQRPVQRLVVIVAADESFERT